MERVLEQKAPRVGSFTYCYHCHEITHLPSTTKAKMDPFFAELPYYHIRVLGRNVCYKPILRPINQIPGYTLHCAPKCTLLLLQQVHPQQIDNGNRCISGSTFYPLIQRVGSLASTGPSGCNVSRRTQCMIYTLIRMLAIITLQILVYSRHDNF